MLKQKNRLLVVPLLVDESGNNSALFSFSTLVEVLQCTKCTKNGRRGWQ